MTRKRKLSRRPALWAASLALAALPALAEERGAENAPPEKIELSSDACREWLADTYQVGARAAELGLDLATRIETTSACVDRDLGMMPPSIPRGWCDNVFKIHCSGLDLLAEVGDALVARCATELSESLGVDVASDRSWTVCGEQRVADAYATDGTVVDAAGCRRILTDECAEVEGDDRR